LKLFNVKEWGSGNNAFTMYTTSANMKPELFMVVEAPGTDMLESMRIDECCLAKVLFFDTYEEMIRYKEKREKNECDHLPKESFVKYDQSMYDADIDRDRQMYEKEPILKLVK
jgi:hypothetical protein